MKIKFLNDNQFHNQIRPLTSNMIFNCHPGINRFRFLDDNNKEIELKNIIIIITIM